MFPEEEAIKNELIKKFEFLQDKITITRVRRIFVDVPLEQFREVFDHAANQMGFEMLYTITGLDNGDSFGAIYHLGRKGIIALNLRVRIPREKPELKTISDRFPAADIYERELIDLFGIEVSGLVPGNRYPLPDGWPEGEYPLRKDWKESMLNDKDEIPNNKHQTTNNDQ